MKTNVPVREAIKGTKGKFFSMTFTRSTTTKNGSAGEEVTRTFRTGVSKGVKGEGLKFDPDQKGLVVLWCRQGFRTIKVDSVKSITFMGEKAEFV